MHPNNSFLNPHHTVIKRSHSSKILWCQYVHKHTVSHGKLLQGARSCQVRFSVLEMFDSRLTNTQSSYPIHIWLLQEYLNGYKWGLGSSRHWRSPCTHNGHILSPFLLSGVWEPCKRMWLQNCGLLSAYTAGSKDAHNQAAQVKAMDKIYNTLNTKLYNN